MQSSKSRYEIVLQALQLSGRDVGIRTFAEDLLNSLLRDWAVSYKYPFLKKIGASVTLSAGTTTASIPSDIGAGMDNLLFGTEKTPLYEKSADEFIWLNGFKDSNAGSGRPRMYMLDLEGGNFVFDAPADQAYPFTPIYYKLPADIPSGDSSYDSQKIWMPNDLLAVQGLIGMIYQYTGDSREAGQNLLVRNMKADFERGLTPVGGGQPKIQLSRSVFRPRRL